MKIAHPEINFVLDFDKNKICSLVIENRDFYRNLLKDINNQIDGLEGKTVLSSDNKIIEFSKNSCIIDSFINFDINQKSLLTKIISFLETEANNEENYVKTQEILHNLENFIDKLAFDLPCSVECSKMSVESILKSAKIEILDDYDNDLEKILDFMNLTREFDRDKLFIFVNLRSFYDDKDVALFLKNALNYEFCLLLIDNCEYKKLDCEQRFIIDNDLCEI